MRWGVEKGILAAVVLALILVAGPFSATVESPLSEVTGPEARDGVETGASGTRAYDFSVEFDEDTETIESGEQRPFDLKVTNSGNQDDGYNLTIETPEINWTAKFSNGMKSMEMAGVSGGSFAATSVFVRAPSKGEATITVLVQSLATATQKKAHITLTVAKDELSLHSVDYTATVDVGGSVGMEVDVTNNNASLTHNVSFSITNLDISTQADEYNWTYYLSADGMDIGPGATVTVTVTLNAPFSAESGATTTTQLMAVIKQDTSGKEFHSNELVVKVEAQYNLYIPAPEHQSVSVNTDVVFTLAVKNNGQSDITVEKPDPILWVSGWNYEVSPSSFDLSGKQTRNVLVTIYLPSDAAHGNHSLALNFAVKGTSYTKRVDMSLSVAQIFGLEWDADLPGNDQQLTMSGQGSYLASLRNTGNGADDVAVDLAVASSWANTYVAAISTSGSPVPDTIVTADFSGTVSVSDAGQGTVVPALNATYSSVTLSLQPAQTAYIWIMVKVEATTPPDSPSDTITLTAGSLGSSNITSTETIPLRLKVAEVSLSLEIPLDLTAGLDVKVVAVVTNTYSTDTGTIAVKLYVDSAVVDQRSVSVAPDTTERVELTWDGLEEGEHLVEVEVTGSSIEPVSETVDPRLTAVGEEKEGEDDDDGSGALVIIMIIIILVVAVVVILLLIVKRSKDMEAEEDKRVRDDEYDKIYGGGGGAGSEYDARDGAWEPPGGGDEDGDADPAPAARGRGKKKPPLRKKDDDETLKGEKTKALPRSTRRDGGAKAKRRSPPSKGKSGGGTGGGKAKATVKRQKRSGGGKNGGDDDIESF